MCEAGGPAGVRGMRDQRGPGYHPCQRFTTFAPLQHAFGGMLESVGVREGGRKSRVAPTAVRHVLVVYARCPRDRIRSVDLDSTHHAGKQ